MTAVIESRIIELAGRASALGLLRSTCGNISARVEEGRFAISGSGSYLGNLQPSDIAYVGVDDPTRRSGARPSSETPMHRAIYLARPEIGAVLHFQSLAATTLACAQTWEVDLNLIPEYPVYVRDTVAVPYFTPGTDALAEAVGQAVLGNEARIVVMRNHGQIALGGDLNEALQAAEFFEFAAQIALQGLALRTLNAQERADLVRYRR